MSEELLIMCLPNDIPREYNPQPGCYLDSFSKSETLERAPDDADIVCDVPFDEI